MTTATRKDSKGKVWTEEKVLRAVRSIVGKLAPGHPTRTIKRKTRFATDLGWDEWYQLRLGRPIRARLRGVLADAVLKKLRTVGELADRVWANMEGP